MCCSAAHAHHGSQRLVLGTRLFYGCIPGLILCILCIGEAAAVSVKVRVAGQLSVSHSLAVHTSNTMRAVVLSKRSA